MVQKNFKSFFKALTLYQKNPNKFKGRPGLPKYLDKQKGRYIAWFTNQAVSKKVFKKTGKIKLSQCNIEFKTKLKSFEEIDCVRIVPKNNHHVIEVVYTIVTPEKLTDNNKYAAIDLGVNNLATIVSNVKKFKPLIINGKPLKSINQFYNKKKAHLQSVNEIRHKIKTSRQVQKLDLKRQNKINHYLHVSSKLIVNILKENNINTLIIGKNDNWKQEVNIGTKNNQNFVSIPHSRFINFINYKCEKEGINVITKNENYTSKCSFLDLETIRKHKMYKGKRIKRGLFISSEGRKINADVNGSYNMLIKVIPNVFDNGIEGVGIHPRVIKILK